MTTDVCSSWSYQEIIRTDYIGERQGLILRIFTENPHRGFTATEIVRLVGRGSSENTRNRITELEQMGFLVKTGKTRCPFSKRLVNSFRWTGKTSKPTYTIQRVACEHCDGKGFISKKIYDKTNRTRDLFPQ